MEFFNPKSFFLTIAAPSITFLFGGSNSGKTHLLGQLLSQFRSLFDSNVKVVILYLSIPTTKTTTMIILMQ